MTFHIQGLSVDFKTNKATITLTDKDNSGRRFISIIVPVPTPGNPDEKDIRKSARKAATDALREALDAIDKD